MLGKRVIFTKGRTFDYASYYIRKHCQLKELVNALPSHMHMHLHITVKDISKQSEH